MGGALTTGCIFDLQVDGPITSGAYKQAGSIYQTAGYGMQ